MNNKNWIKSPVDLGSASVIFTKIFDVKKDLIKATLKVTSVGVYEAALNGQKASIGMLNPGYTSYDKRLQYQTFDVTQLLCEKEGEHKLEITTGPGWAVGHLTWFMYEKLYGDNMAVNAELSLEYSDRSETFVTDETWEVYTSKTEFSEIYAGETVNMLHKETLLGNAVADVVAEQYPLIAQEGEYITEHERLAPVAFITTPKGERVIDFGQNMTGFVEFKIKAKAGERIVISHAEVLDKDGNFYNANYRQAKNIMTYICDGNENVFKPRFSFQGFRYIRLDEYPNVEIDLDSIRAVAVHSDMARTGRFSCGNEKINQLYHNTIWGQKSNYLDVPTDCPQRDERLGWTGDAQVFCRTAALNFDVRKFFKKWLGDLRVDQREDGAVWGVCPNSLLGQENVTRVSAAWGDCATIVPWELYRAYGDKSVLEENFELMKNWVEYMRSVGDEEYLWLTGYHYGDWLAMDAGGDSYVGATSNDLIASAFFAHSTDLLIRAGEVLGKDMSNYRELHKNIVKRFREYFMENGMPKEELPFTEINPPYRKTVKVIDTVRKGVTQTAIVLILHFDLCTDEERPVLADKLAELIHEFGDLMATGFVGTPYILHVLSDHGKTDMAYKLLLEERNPSWLYSVTHGATTIWEHWNGIKEDGGFWSTDMNSFNHYAYGSVCDWLYGVVAGITVSEEGVGYKKFTLTPHPSKALGHVNCALETVNGRIESRWYYKGEQVFFEFTVPCGTEAVITLPNGYTETVSGGTYHYTV